MMARSSRARSHPGGRSRSRHSQRTGSIEIFTRPHQNPVLRVLGWVIRLRAEITVMTVLITVTVVVRDQIGPGQTALVVGFTAVAVIGIPASRRFVGSRWWSVIDRHRVRTCFMQTRTMTHDGRLPLLLWSRPSPVGERVRVWLPAGLSVKDIDRVTDEIATACWARSVRVTPSHRQAAFVVVDVVRHDPLSAAEIIPDGVEDLDPADEFDPDDEGTVVALPNRDQFTTRASRKAPSTPTGTTGPAARGTADARTSGKTGKNAAAQRQTVDDEDADPSL